MKLPQYLILTLLLVSVICVAGVGADNSMRDTFQGWGSNNFGFTGIEGAFLYNATTGQIIVSVPVGSYGYGYNLTNTNDFSFNYLAYDVMSVSGAQGFPYALLLDSNKNLLSRCWISSTTTPYHAEIVITAGAFPAFYRNGVLQAGACSASVASYPHYVAIAGYNAGAGGTGSGSVDNPIITGSGVVDYHVVGALPTNWSIHRDLINSLNNGVYSWNNATQTWTLRYQINFFIDADAASVYSPGNETFVIADQYGDIINTTTINTKTSPYNTIAYNLTHFLATSVGTSSQLPDGEYYAYFVGYQTSADTFWVMSSGATVAWDKTTYAAGGSATISYTVTSGYWDTSTYDYAIKVVDVYGNTIKTQTVNTNTGTVTISDLDSTTYPAGVYYAELTATGKSDAVVHILNYASMTTTAYVYFSGYVMNATSGAVIPTASVNVTQGTSYLVSTSAADGSWSSSNNWIAGVALSVNTTKTGYTNNLITEVPLSGKTIALNVSLMPTTVTNPGITIGGVVRDNVYSNPIPGATYHVANTTTGESYTCTTNIAGYCYVPSLTNLRYYQVWGSKTGYGNSTVTNVEAVGT